MKMRLEDKRRAIDLRIRGKSYSEIRSIIPNLPKATLSNWIRGVNFTPEQEENLKRHLQKISYSARIRSAWAKKEEKKKRIQKIFNEAEIEYLYLSKNPFFLICLSLLLGRGKQKNRIFSIY